MPPRRFSRFSFCEVLTDQEGRRSLSDREPFRFRHLDDNREHRCAQGETWTGLAARYFVPLPRPDGLWWVICDFQPVPIVDATVMPVPGTIVIIPSVRTVTELVFAERRRAEH